VERQSKQLPDQDLVRLYLSDVGKHGLLTKEQETDLARAIERGHAARRQLADDGSSEVRSPSTRRRLEREVRGGDAATDCFVEANLRLVVSIAKRYQTSGLPLLDLIQEGNLGLIHAVEKFDWRKGFKFSTYATWWIRQAIARGIANSGRTVRVPVHAGELATRAHRLDDELQQRLGRRATFTELVEELGVPETRVVEALRFSAPPRSLSEPLGEDGGTVLADVVHDLSAVSPSAAAVASLLHRDVEAVLSELEPRERDVLRLRFGLDSGQPCTLDEVGRAFRLTRERIRQIEAKALNKLRHPTAAPHARELIGD
jgi:RNA polymerase sigma factor (sigma-70 family)